MHTTLINVLEIMHTQEKRNKIFWIQLKSHPLRHRGYLISVDSYVLKQPQISYYYFTFYFGLPQSKMICFLLKEAFRLESIRFPGGLKELMQFPRVSNFQGVVCACERVWLQDICSHPKTNLAQLKMSARQRIQCCQATQLVLYFMSTKFTQQCFVLKKSLKFTITGFIYQSHMGLTIFGYICKAFTKKNPQASQISRIGGQSG